MATKALVLDAIVAFVLVELATSLVAAPVQDAANSI
jgi:hypothetical protein